MKIRHIEAVPGEHAYGFLEASRSLSQMPMHIPIHIFNGAHEGPTLLVSGAVHGTEIIGSMGLHKVMKELDLQTLRGTLISVPIINTSGLEEGTRTTGWDGENMDRTLASASPDGSPSAQLAHIYLTEILPHADAVINMHSGGTDSFVWYTIYPGEYGDPEVIEKSRQMAIAFGLRQVFRSTPKSWEGFHTVAKDQGKPAIMPEIGGGTDFKQNGKYQIDMAAQGIRNVMYLLDMLDGEIVTEMDTVEICDGLHEIESGTLAGLMLWECEHGQRLEKGDVFSRVFHPYTGEEIGQILAPETGTVLNTGKLWPTIHQNQWLALLGDIVEKVPVEFSD